MLGRDYRVLEEAFKDSTSIPFGYLLIDLKQRTPENQRIRTHILPGQNLAVYVNKKEFKDKKLTIYA
jgi:hypothetical protein